jgi:glutathionyl-hydroquinone reductase
LGASNPDLPHPEGARERHFAVGHALVHRRAWLDLRERSCVIPDPIGRAERLYEIYLRSNPTYTCRVTVPVLWDKERNVIVSNESSEIIHMINSAFDGVGATQGEFYPAVPGACIIASLGDTR